MRFEKAVVLMGGGLRSAVTLAHAFNEYNDVTAVTVHTGNNVPQAWAAKQLVDYYKEQVTARSMPNKLADAPVTVVGMSHTPQLLGLFGWMFASDLPAKTLYLGFGGGVATRHLIERLRFFATQENLPGINLQTPVLWKNTVDVIRSGMELNAPLFLALSCHTPTQKGEGDPYVACRKCARCKARQDAFDDLGVDDPAVLAEKNS